MVTTCKLSAREISGLVAENLIEELALFCNNQQDQLNKEDLKGLSMDYEIAEREANIKYEQLRTALPADYQKQLSGLIDARKNLEIAGNVLYYKHGLSNGVKMLLHQTIINMK